jgi:hypothetical protein
VSDEDLKELHPVKLKIEVELADQDDQELLRATVRSLLASDAEPQPEPSDEDLGKFIL